MPASSDRNLLFGILALQMDFITRDQLVTAMNAWVLHKSKPLGQVLVEQNALMSVKRDLLEPLVDQHVKDHAGDPQKSLAALSSVDATLKQRLAALTDAAVQASIAHVGMDRTPVDPNATIGQPPGETPTAGRYRILRAHARGGLGEVFVAEDTELGRHVALKEIQSRYADDGTSRSRFILEAEITGGLEHPGIVPVYGLGAYADGRPFYAMRFIKGDNLKDAIQRFHSEPRTERSGVSGPASAPLTPLRSVRGSGASFDSLEFRGLLRRFVDVCNAVAYAHSRGVLHRDLKPGNIMLGKYGETLVVDWGLAKVQTSLERERPETADPTLMPRSAGSSSATIAGAALGTPSYMPPEQANGEIDNLGPASDVYSLGATLYEVLTGKPPFESGMLEVVLADVRAGRFLAPSRVAPGLPRALGEVCLKAMARNPNDRYGSPLDVAKEIERWLADEPVTAYTEPFSARARRWVRRHARLVTGIGVALLFGIIGLGLLAYERERSRKAVARESSEKEIARAAAVEANEQSKKRLAQVEKFNEILASIFRDLDPKLAAKDGKPLRAILGERLDKATAEIEGDVIGDSLAVAYMQFTLGESQLGLGYADRAVRLFASARATFARELGPDHRDTLNSMANLASGYHALGRLDVALALDEETLKLKKAKLGPDHSDTLSSMGNLAGTYLALGRLDEALSIGEEALRLRKAKFGADHAHTLASMNNLAVTYRAAGRLVDAVSLSEEVLKITRATLGPDHPDTLTSMNNLAVNYRAASRLGDALPLSEEVHRRRKATLGPDHPDTLTSMNNLAVAYKDAGRLADALPFYEEAFKLRKAKFGPDHPDTLTSMAGLANSYQASGRLDGALPLFEEAARGIEQLQFRHQFAGPIITGTAGCLEELRRFDAAEAWRRKWLEVVKKESGSDAPSYAAALAPLALNLLHQEKWADAQAMLRESLTIRTTKEPEAWTTFDTQSLLGESLLRQQQMAAAEPLLLTGFGGMKQRAEKIPMRERARLAAAAERLVRLYEALGKPEEAAKFRKELEALKAPPPMK